MQKFDIFYFESFSFDKYSLKSKFIYSFDHKNYFEEEIDFSSKDFFIRDDIDFGIIKNILFHIHIAFWISYYKLFPTKNLVVKTWILNENQTNFWKKFYLNGLWEFFYRNKISPIWLCNFINDSDISFKKKEFETKSKSLVPIWWWKDSIVSIELLKKNSFSFDLFTFWPKDNILYKKTQEISGKNRLFIKRYISDLSNFKKGEYYNWHVPITWLIAFVMILVWYLYEYKYLVLSNEKSSNFWNVKWDWLNINHQYSKSFEFEKDFKSYTQKYITKNIFYFSLLRWFYEINIAKLFYLLWKKYFSFFSSCNYNFKIFSSLDKNKIPEKYWCNSCPKCVFVFTILRPYLSTKEVLQIFWKDLFQDLDLENIFKELLWISWIKPFECVWEKEEVIFSMYKSLGKYKKIPFALKMFEKEVLPKFTHSQFLKMEEKLYKIYKENIIPKDFEKI